MDHNLEAAVEVWGMVSGPELFMRLVVAIQIDQVYLATLSPTVTGRRHCRIPQARLLLLDLRQIFLLIFKPYTARSDQQPMLARLELMLLVSRCLLRTLELQLLISKSGNFQDACE